MNTATPEVRTCRGREWGPLSLAVGIPDRVNKIKSNVDPRDVLTRREPLTSAIEAFRNFGRREAGWIKVELLAGN